MKVLVFLFCLLVATCALPVHVNNNVGLEINNAPIDDQYEGLIVAETAHREVGYGGGYGGGRGGIGYGPGGRGNIPYGGGYGVGGGVHGGGRVVGVLYA